MKRRLAQNCLLLCMAAVLLALSGAAQAQDVPKFPLKPLLRDLAVTHDRIKAADASYESSQHMVEKAKSGWYPRLDATAEGGYEEMSKPGQATTEKWRNVQGLRATQLLYDFGGTSGNIDMYSGLSGEMEARRDQTVQDVLIRGISAYLTTIRARETLKYAIQSEDNIKRLSGMQEALVARGAGLSYEELQVKAQLAGSQSYRVTQERALATARNMFRSVFGFEPDDAQIQGMVVPVLPKGLIPDTLDTALDTAVKNNFALKELESSVARAEGDLQSRKASFYPKFQLVGETLRKENDQGDRGLRDENRASVLMTYNIFSGMGDTENVSAANADVTAARKGLLDRRRTVEENVRNAWVDLDTLRKNVELYQNQANITWEFLGLIKKKKAMGGEVNLLDILVGERDYISAVSSRVATEIDETLAGYTLLYQMGHVSLDNVAR